MKIYEIISENQTEGVDGIVTRLAKLPFKSIGKAFNSERSQLVAKLADRLALQGRYAGAATPREALKAAKRLGPVANKMVRDDPQILADAAREANKVRNPSLWNKMTGASRGASSTAAGGEKFFTAYNVAAKGLMAWGLYELWAPPLSDYWTSMDNAKANLDSGKWTKENYRHEENKQLSTLIGRLGAALLITGVPAWMMNNKATRYLLGKYIGGFVGLSVPAAVIFFRQWLNRDDNADRIAAVMMNDYVAGNAEMMGTPIPGLGSLAAKAKREIAGDVSADPSAATGANGGQSASPAGATAGAAGKQDIDSTSTPGKTNAEPNGKAKPSDAPTTSKPYVTPKGRKMYSNDPLALRNYDITGWVRKPGQPGWIMDPKDPSDMLQEPPGWTPD